MCKWGTSRVGWIMQVSPHTFTPVHWSHDLQHTQLYQSCTPLTSSANTLQAWPATLSVMSQIFQIESLQTRVRQTKSLSPITKARAESSSQAENPALPSTSNQNIKSLIWQEWDHLFPTNESQLFYTESKGLQLSTSFTLGSMDLGL